MKSKRYICTCCHHASNEQELVEDFEETEKVLKCPKCDDIIINITMNEIYEVTL